MISFGFLLLAALAQAPAQAPPPPQNPATPPPAPSGPTVLLTTTLGNIKIVLDKEKAPISTDNFLKYVRAKHYDGTIFHRVIPGFMIQGGGMTQDMVDKPGALPPIHNEAKNGLRNSRGTVAMARTGDPNSATDQFFINVKDNHSLDFGIAGAGYAVFGQVVEGMDVVDKILAVQTTSKGQYQNVPIAPVVIKTAREVPASAPAAAAPKP
jgi:cyclophilin family peptidyl-prolyl cis-trans isomerase